MAAPNVMSDEELFQLTGSWEAAAEMRDDQYRALNDYNNSLPAVAEPVAATVAAPAAVAEPAAAEETAPAVTYTSYETESGTVYEPVYTPAAVAEPVATPAATPAVAETPAAGIASLIPDAVEEPAAPATPAPTYTQTDEQGTPVYEPPAVVAPPVVAPVATPPSGGGKLDLEPADEPAPPPVASVAPTGIAALAPTTTPETPTGVAALTPTTPALVTPTAPTTPANTVKYHDGTTYNATELSTLTNQIIGLTDKLGVDKSWKGDALKAGDNANIGFDAATGKKILGTDTITNKQQVALDMAANLNNAGVKNLTEIGMGDIKGDVSAKADVDENGNPTGTYSKLDTKTGQWVPADPKDIRTVTTGDGENQQQTIVATGVTGQGLINKTNGQAIGDGSGTIGSTYTGKGATDYKLKIDEATGLPIFYTAGRSTNDVANLMEDLGPIGQIGLAIATGGLSIPQQIAANMAVQLLSGKELKDVVKGAATSYLTSQIPGSDLMKDGASFIKDLGLSPEITSTLTKGLQNAASSTVGAVISGQDAGEAFLKGFTTGGINGAVNSLANNIEGFSDLTPSQKNMVTNVVTGVVSGKPLDQLVINTAINAASAAVVDANKTKSTDVVDTLKNAGLTDGTSTSNLATKDIISSITGGGTTTKIDNDITSILQSAGLTQDDEFSGVDAAVAATAKANNTAIGNTEADTPEEAMYLAKSRNPTGTSFTFGGKTYNMTPSESQVQSSLAQSKIDSASNFNDAFKIARDNLGAGKTFTWNGKEYSTATATERPDLTGKTTKAVATDQSDAETARLANLNKSLVTGNAEDQSAAETKRLAGQNAALKATEKTGFFSNLANSISDQMKLSSEAANDYLKKNPDSPITNSVSTAMEAAGNLQKNVAGGTALLLDNKPLADAFVKSGDDLTKFGQSIGKGVVDTKNWNETMGLLEKAQGWEKLGLMAGRIMDGTSGLGRQVEVELRQELPGLFLGGGSVKGILLATGAMDVGETTGNAALEAYDDAIKKGANHKDALSDARKAGASAGATEAAIQLTLGKLADFGVGKISNVGTKAGTKVVGEGVIEGTQEGGASLAVDAVLGNELNVNKALTQAVAGAAVGKGTAVATSPTDIATSETINNNISTAVTAGDAAGVNKAISSSVQTSLSSGSSVEVAVGSTVTSAITNGADANSSITNAVSTAVENGADVTQTVTTSIDSAITAGADSTVAINSTVTSAISSGADVTQTVTGSITAATTAGVDTSVAINNTVTSAITSSISSGADASTSINSTVTSAVTTAINNNVNSTAAVTTAVDSAITTAINNNVNANTAITTSVTAAINASVNANVNANVNVNANINAATNTAVTAAVTAAVNAGVDTNTAITAAVNAAVNVNTNVNIDELTKVATDAATTPTVPPAEPTVTPPVTPPQVTPPPVTPPPVTPPVVTPPVVKPPVVKPPVVKPPVKTSAPFSMPEAQAIAATFGVPQLANVFYYGKDFGSKKQKLDKKGQLQQEEYDPLSVTQAGAAGELAEDIAEERKNKENNANDALDLILGESSNSMSIDDILNIVKGG
jgi:trimeric autotransporter adhesin